MTVVCFLGFGMGKWELIRRLKKKKKKKGMENMKQYQVMGCYLTQVLYYGGSDYEMNYVESEGFRVFILWSLKLLQD